MKEAGAGPGAPGAGLGEVGTGRCALPRVTLVLLALAAAGSAQAAAFAPPPAPARWATDRAGFLSEAARTRLDAKLEEYERLTGRQVIVYVDRSTGDIPLEEWAARAFQAWGIGRRGQDDGAALFVFSEDRALRIEVGYGLEGQLTDLRADRIIQTIAVPQLRAGSPDAAVEQAVDALLRELGGAGSLVPAAASQPSGGIGAAIMGALFLIFVFIVFVTVMFGPFALMIGLIVLESKKGKGRRTGGSTGRSSWGSGSGSSSSGRSSGRSSGGFSGGGGRSGGGGASGRW